MATLLSNSIPDVSEASDNDLGRAFSLRKSLIDFSAGCAGGAACTIFAHPVDTLKVRLQTFKGSYRGWLDCGRQVLMGDGLRGLYRGLTPSLAASMAELGILFLFYKQFVRIVEVVARMQPGQAELLHHGISGAMASLACSCVLTPLELIKCRQQTGNDPGRLGIKNMNLLLALRSVVRSDGFFGLYRGFSLTAARDIIGGSLFFGTYETVKSTLVGSKTRPDIIDLTVAGGVGGVVSWIMVYPLDAVKSRVQVHDGSASVRVSSFIWNMLKNSGVRTLYRGLVITCLATFPSCAVLFVVNELSMQKLTSLFSAAPA